MQKLGAFLKEKGLYTYVHWHTFFTNPPLSINEQELKEGFEIINEALAISDKYAA